MTDERETPQDTPWRIEMDCGELTVLDAQRRVVARIGGQKLAWWERVVAAINAVAGVK